MEALDAQWRDAVKEILHRARSLQRLLRFSLSYGRRNTKKRLSRRDGANGSTIHAAVEETQKPVADAQETVDNAETARQPATVTVLADMRGVIKNLEAKLSKNDPRWLAFGLQIPAMNTTPGSHRPRGAAEPGEWGCC